ncbi:MAG: cytochrome C assembly family protein [Deltaproteobacteria bacterium]
MFWHWIIASCYLASSIFYFAHLWIQNPRVSVWGTRAVILGAALHTASLIAIFKSGNPIAGGFDSSLYFFSWFIALVYIASQLKFRTNTLGAFAAPLVLFMTLPSLILPQGIIEHDPSLRNPWILTHIALMFLGEALFTFAFIASALYIFQESRIKSKRMGNFLMKLPSLTSLDNLSHLCLLIGFPVLTAGLVLGVISAKEIWGELWHWGHKETWSMITWFLYAALIHGRLAAGWRGRKSAIGAAVGFAVILFTFFIIGYLAPGRHNFFLGAY